MQMQLTSNDQNITGRSENFSSWLGIAMRGVLAMGLHWIWRKKILGCLPSVSPSGYRDDVLGVQSRWWTVWGGHHTNLLIVQQAGNAMADQPTLFTVSLLL